MTLNCLVRASAAIWMRFDPPSVITSKAARRGRDQGWPREKSMNLFVKICFVVFIVGVVASCSREKQFIRACEENNASMAMTGSTANPACSKCVADLETKRPEIVKADNRYLT